MWERDTCTEFDCPKAIANVRSVSCSYSLLWRFGVIRVPEKVEKNLRKRRVVIIWRVIKFTHGVSAGV